MPSLPPTEPHVAAPWRPPAWLDTDAYPFRPRTFDSAEGRMRYVDEGSGPPVVLVHGTPVWSFVWRDLIARLVRAGHRVIAPDHLGFGLSDKPPDAGYRPEDHSRRLAALLDTLDLPEVTLVAHDFGGPIGLTATRPAADVPSPGPPTTRRPRLARLVLLNTWGWALDGDARIARGARLAAGALGGFLYRRLNASPRWLLPSVFANRRRLTSAVHAQYLAPFPDAPSRLAPWALARALLGASAWYDALWARRAALADVPALLVWGMRDPTFGPAYLDRWRGALPQARVVELTDAGHFVQEEAPGALADAVEEFLREPAPAVVASARGRGP